MSRNDDYALPGTDLALTVRMLSWTSIALAAVIAQSTFAPPVHAQSSERWLEFVATITAEDVFHPRFLALEQARHRYERIAASGGWPQLPPDTLLKREENDGAVADGEGADPDHDPELLATLCERLAVTGDLPGPPCESRIGFPTYDRLLEQAVRSFQWRHGLVVDGIVGPRTLEAMNVPVEQRLAQLKLNMDRWLHTPIPSEGPRVRVNVPGFFLEAKERHTPVLTMRVVAGEADTPTPIFEDEIEYLEFRPYWNVPESITEQELLPRIREDRSYLERQRFEVVDGWSEPARIIDPARVDWSGHFPYRLRQRPGRLNSLGLVKFMFPNDYSVYLHDTPAVHRFEDRQRSYSHGCVRVEDPVALAEFLLRGEGNWTRDAIERAMYEGDRKVVPLSEPVPVQLQYFTAWVDDGVVHFREDIYGHDARALAAITN